MTYVLTEAQLLKIIKENRSEKKDDEVKPNNIVNFEGKVVDLSDLSKQEKMVLDLKEKVVIDNSKKEYPIVMIQLRNGKVIVFDVNETLDEF